MRAIYYDFETTGLKADKDRVIELAFFDAASGQHFSSFVNPGVPISAEITAITGINDAMVKDAPPFSALIESIISFCQSPCILVAHNNDAFDYHFLKTEFERSGQKLPEWKFFDSLKWAKKYRPDLPKHALQYLREIYKIEENNAHRALDDVKVLASVVSKLLDDLPIATAVDLLYGSAVPSQEQTMPFGKHKGTLLKQLPKGYLDWLKQSGALDKKENSSLKEAIERLHGALV